MTLYRRIRSKIRSKLFLKFLIKIDSRPAWNAKKATHSTHANYTIIRFMRPAWQKELSRIVLWSSWVRSNISKLWSFLSLWFQITSINHRSMANWYEWICCSYCCEWYDNESRRRSDYATFRFRIKRNQRHLKHTIIKSQKQNCFERSCSVCIRQSWDWVIFL